MFDGERKVVAHRGQSRVRQHKSVTGASVNLPCFQKMDKSAKHINFPLDAFVLPRHRTGLDIDATAMVSPYLRGCGALAEKSADLDVSDCLEQCAEALEELHRSGIVHCDVKPDNFCVGDTVFIIDFGLARFASSEKYRAASFFGTQLYAPLAAHLLQPQGFRDDLEALATTPSTSLLAVVPLPWANSQGQRETAGESAHRRQEKASRRNPRVHQAVSRSQARRDAC